MDIVAGGFKKGGRPSGERDRLQPTKQQGGTDQGPEEQGSRPVKRCVMPLREFQPRAYEDDSDDDHDPYAALNARRLQEAKDGQKRAEVVRKAGKASRPGRLAQGVHYINPGKNPITVEDSLFNGNIFLEVRIGPSSPDKASISLVNANNDTIVKVLVRDPEGEERSSNQWDKRYLQLQVQGAEKNKYVDVPKDLVPLHPGGVYAFRFCLNRDVVKVQLNAIEVARFKVPDRISFTRPVTVLLEGDLEMKAVHIPTLSSCNLNKASIGNSLFVGDRINLFGKLKKPKDQQAPLLTLGEVVVLWPDVTADNPNSRVTLQRLKKAIVAYLDNELIYRKEHVEGLDAGGQLAVDKAFTVEALWIERLADY